MEDIGKKLGISKNSVSIALSGRKGISESLRSKVIETAHQMKYGALPVHNKSRYVVTIVPEYLRNDTFFYADVLNAIKHEAQMQNCIAINYYVSRESEDAKLLPSCPSDIDVAGYLVVGVLSEEYVSALYDTGLPVLSVDIQYHSASVGCVGSANVAGGAQAAEFLISSGHRDIGFIGPIFTAQSVYERWCGFRQALIYNGLDFRDELCIVGSAEEVIEFNNPEKLATFIDSVQDHPTVWFCAGDLIAAAMINCLAKKGIKVPDDVSIMGYDDIALSEVFYPRLTTMRVDRERMGQLAVQYLLGNFWDNGFSVNIELRSKLVVRDSVKIIT